MKALGGALTAFLTAFSSPTNNYLVWPVRRRCRQACGPKEVGFNGVLEKKNAKASLQQIICELDTTQLAVWSPIILNGTGFGLMANHSLVMANYISPANAAINDMRQWLEKG